MSEVSHGNFGSSSFFYETGICYGFAVSTKDYGNAGFGAPFTVRDGPREMHKNSTLLKTLMGSTIFAVFDG